MQYRITLTIGLLATFFLIGQVVGKSCTLTASIPLPAGQCSATTCSASKIGISSATASCSGDNCVISATADGNCDGCDSACSTITGAFKTASCSCSSSGGSCFPSTAILTLKDGSSIRMDELKLGDEVLVSSDGSYSPVYVFGHKLKEFSGPFVRLFTKNHNISLTADHLIYVNKELKPAGNVIVGDNLETKDGSVEKVVKITTHVEKGLYNPHTLHGDIFVNGIRASTYTNAINPSLAHWLLSPLRALYHSGIDIIGDRWNNGIVDLNN